MDKRTFAELFGPPSVVFGLFYMFMFARGLANPAGFSLFMAMLSFGIAVRKRRS
jgi:hypothetical protein